MKAWIAGFLLLALGLAGGYWLGHQTPAPEPTSAPERKPLYYRNPMDPSVTSPVPAKDAMGMDYVPVYEEPAAEKKPLHYRHPMNPSVTSPVPAKDEMGMDYVPVYEDAKPRTAAANPGEFRLAPEKIQTLGVRTAVAERRPLGPTVRATGIVEADERRMHDVALKFEAYLETLTVNATGQEVRAGQVLAEVYSPELLAAQREVLLARAEAAGAAPNLKENWERLVRSGLERLRNAGIAETELQRLLRENQARRTLPVRAPASGVVMEKKAVAGMRVMAGEILYRIADLSTVWVQAEVFERDLGLVAPGQKALLRIDAYPERVFEGRVAFIYPMLNAATRTARVRLELPNPEGLLKPMMYARTELATPARPVLAVPASAVLDSGKRTVVLVDRGGGRFQARPVELGMSADDFVEVRSGIGAGDRVVVSANFLLDAESNLQGVLGSMGDGGGSAESKRQVEPAPQPPSPASMPAHNHGAH